MAKAKSTLFKKLGSVGRKAIEEHKDDAITFPSGGDLPAGIEDGKARLNSCGFDTYKTGPNKGEYYFRASGIILSPKSVEGRSTSIMEAVCDTPQSSRATVNDHFEWILNELRKLGVDTTEVDISIIEEVASSLVEEAPVFTFRTWKGKKATSGPWKDVEPRTREDWLGLDADYVEEDSEDVEEGEEDSEDEEVKEKPRVKKTSKKSKKAEAEENEEEEGEDVIALGEEADGGDSDSQTSLSELATKAGLNPDEYETWTELAEVLSSPAKGEDGEEEEEEEEEEEAIEPTKGEVYGYKPPKSRKAIDCEVTAVFAGKETCNLKSLDDGKVFKSIPYASLVLE